MARWRLREGEELLAVGRPALIAVWPLYVATAGLYGFWHKRRTALLTNHRIIVGRGVINREERMIPMDHIRRAGYFRRGLAAYCQLDTSDDHPGFPVRIGPLTTRLARRFVDEVESRT